MAIALNVARRQLNAEDRQELVVKLRAEGQSTRQIAEALGVDPKTVRNDLNDASEATGENSPVDRVTGKDGKSRPARMPAKAKAKKAAPATEAPQAPAPPTEPTAPVSDGQSEPLNNTIVAFNALIPYDQVLAMRTFWGILSPVQRKWFWEGLSTSQRKRFQKYTAAGQDTQPEVPLKEQFVAL
jgi:transposase-like protein